MTPLEALAAASTPHEAAAASAAILADFDEQATWARAEAARRLDAVRARLAAATAIADQALAAARDALGDDGVRINIEW